VRAAVAFLTAIGGSTPPTERAFLWFPTVGAVVGAVLGAAWWGAGEAWAPAQAAVIVVIADLAVTGMLHVDGLADSADGLLPPLGSRERRLEVMADPATGAFGVAAVVAVLLARVVALSGLAPHALLLAGIWCASRTAMAVVAMTVPYARDHGLATAFLGPNPAARRTPVLLMGAVAAGALVAAGNDAPLVATAAALVALLAVAVALAVLARRRLGGFTGDVLGAIGIVGETVALLVLAARW
jgi:adenosylcobinamide-GDP ribazoletransferase